MKAVFARLDPPLDSLTLRSSLPFSISLKVAAPTFLLYLLYGYAHAEGSTCPVTALRDSAFHGDKYIAVNLLQMKSGVIGPPLIWTRDGELRVKLGWRRGISGVALTIEGRRLDADAAPLRVWIPSHPGEIGGQTAVLFFPLQAVGK